LNKKASLHPGGAVNIHLSCHIKERNYDVIVKFECPHCKTKLRAENDIASPTALCPACNKKIVVPQSKQRETRKKEKQKSTSGKLT